MNSIQIQAPEDTLTLRHNGGIQLSVSATHSFHSSKAHMQFTVMVTLADLPLKIHANNGSSTSDRSRQKQASHSQQVS